MSPKLNTHSIQHFLALILTVLSLYASSQETSGGLTGKISDEKNQPLPGATIVAIHLPSGSQYATLANEKGRYVLVGMRVGGPYNVQVSQIGMQAQVRENIDISLGVPQVLDVTLLEGAKSLSEVVVKAVRSGPKAGSTGAGVNISSAQLRNLPASSRSFQDYTRLTPQFNGNSFTGTNFRYNNVTIDGAINNDAIGFSPSLGGQTGTSGQPGSSTRTTSISIDAIQNIQVYLAPFDVKIGNFTGGSINAVTRSGTNQITGSIYAYGQQALLTGRDAAGGTGKTPTDFHDLQTGFRLGFPLIKNKLFFFTNEEITRRVDPLTQTDESAITQAIITKEDAAKLGGFVRSIGFDPGTSGAYSIYSNSTKLFNRLDWNIASGHQLAIRNNTAFSEATNLERDDQNFRFSGIDYVQHNTQNSSVVELKSRLTAKLSNSFVFGFSAIHDYRNPLSDAYYPQIQIGGKTIGTTILLGTDREASIFDLRQRTTEITDNVTLFKGRHTFTFGTHNELYKITYGFVNSPNGRVDFPTLQDFLDNRPSRIRGNYNYVNQNRSYILNNPTAAFKVNMYSAYVQDEIQVNDRLKLVPGLRVDLADLPQKQPYSIKTLNAVPDLNYGTSYEYTSPRNIKNNYLSGLQVSPRLGFNWALNETRNLIVRGGTGLFTGRIPFAWLGYAFYNNGNTYGAFDKRYDYVGNPTAAVPVAPVVPKTGTDPRRPYANGIFNSVQNEVGKSASDANGLTQVDLVDNHFKMPQVWRSSWALDFISPGGYKLTLEGIYTKTLNDVKFQQVNLQDSAVFYTYDNARNQPIFNGKVADPSFTGIYLLSNTHKGYRYSLTAQISKSFPLGLDVSGAYTFGRSKDISNGIRNSMESNWQLNQSFNPNNPGLAGSNFDIRHRIVATAGFRRSYGEGRRHTSGVSLFFSAASGQPFTYGFVNTTIQKTPQQVSLAYIPGLDEFSKFFQSGNITYNDLSVKFKSKEDQAAEFYNYVKNVPYLNERLGEFTRRNEVRTPWNVGADIRFAQDFAFQSGIRKHTVTLSYDIFNLTNLINSGWGKVYFVSNLFNSTASVGLKPTGRVSTTGFPIYTWEEPAKPYQIDLAQSRYRMQLGLRYTF